MKEYAEFTPFAERSIKQPNILQEQWHFYQERRFKKALLLHGQNQISALIVARFIGKILYLLRNLIFKNIAML